MDHGPCVVNPRGKSSDHLICLPTITQQCSVHLDLLRLQIRLFSKLHVTLL
uniref:Uncharacterized protein n=1 Tax=Mola mola TaxID=94237 RepID=A0A3Q3X1D5_MOLML